MESKYRLIIDSILLRINISSLTISHTSYRKESTYLRVQTRNYSKSSFTSFGENEFKAIGL